MFRALYGHPFCHLRLRHGQGLCLVEWAVNLFLWERSGIFVNKLFGISRVCVARPVKVFGSDKLLK